MTASGKNLFDCYENLKLVINEFIDKAIFNQRPDFRSVEEQVKKALGSFDRAWTRYEQYYVYELMVIESDARRFITESIKIEQEMQEIERKLEARGADIYQNEEYNAKRSELIAQMA